MMTSMLKLNLSNGIVIETNTLMVGLVAFLMLYSLSIIRYAIKMNFCIKVNFLTLESPRGSSAQVNYYDTMLKYKDKMSAIAPIISLKPRNILEWVMIFFKKSK